MTGSGGTAAPTGKVSFLDTSFSNTVLGAANLGSSTAGMGLAISSTAAMSNNPVDEIKGDFNGDGIQDLAMLEATSTGSATVAIFLGNGDGTFTAGATTQVALTNNTFTSLVAGDFNNDGKTDLALLSYDYSYVVNVTTLLGAGDGSFTVSSTNQVLNPGVTSGNFISGAMAAADFNGDGKLDLAIVGDYVSSGGVTIALGNGDGTFTASATHPASSYGFNSIAVGDFNGDGIPDLVATALYNSSAVVLLGAGDGTFTATNSTLTVGSFPSSIAVGDLNGDGSLDVAIGNSTAVSVFLGNGDGTFTAGAGNPLSSAGLSLQAGDFDGDGKLDLAGTDRSNDQIDLLEGAGDGTFTKMVATPNVCSSCNPLKTIAGDFNGDGVPDLAMISNSTATASILLTEPTQTARATITGVAPVGTGSHLVAASYEGDSHYGASVSGTTSLSAGLAPLVITPASGTYTTQQTVTISESIPGATIYYMLGGAQSSGGWVQYTGPIAIDRGGTVSLTAYATETGYTQTSQVSMTYNLTLPATTAPVISLPSGYYAGSQSVSITDTDASATIYYTTNGTTPTVNSNVYSGPMTVSTSETLVAIASASGHSLSSAVSAQYAIGSSTVPMIYSVAGTGMFGYAGDGGPATQAQISSPMGLIKDAAGNLYFSDEYNQMVRRIDASTGILSTVAGNGTAAHSGDGGQATSASLYYPAALAMDSAGNLYIAEANAVRKVNLSSGIITTVAGNPGGTSSGSGLATDTVLSGINGIALDASNNLYITDASFIRQVNASTGAIAVIAGTINSGQMGDGGAASSAQFSNPHGMAFDASGNLYIADMGDSVIRKISAVNGVITPASIVSTVAGTTVVSGSYEYGVSGYSGDGGAATSAKMMSPTDVALDSAGNLFVSEAGNNVIRKVAAADGTISTVAGNGKNGLSIGSNVYGDDGAAAISSALSAPYAVMVDSSENLYIADQTSRIRVVPLAASIPTAQAATPVFNIEAGTYATAQSVTISDATPGATIYLTLDGTTPVSGKTYGYSLPISVTGDVTVKAIAVAPGYMASNPATATYKVTADSPLISTYAGSGGTISSINLSNPQGVAFDKLGNFYVSDKSNHVVWKVTATTQGAAIVAGTGTAGYTGDSSVATSATLKYPSGLALDSAGNLYIADTGNNAIRKVNAATGIITTYAGGQAVIGDINDGKAATAARLNAPQSIAFDSADNLYIADNGHERIRKVTAATGIISTVAGNGGASDLGDGGLATSANLYTPQSVVVDSAGNIYIASTYSSRIRKVTAATGIINSIAGYKDIRGDTGNDGSATSAEIQVSSLAIDANGNLFLGNLPGEVRKIDAATGVISRVAGLGFPGYSGDGGAATSALMNTPAMMAFDAAGNLFIADAGNKVVREVAMGLPTAATPVFSVAAGTYTSAQSVAITDSTPNVTIYYTTDGSTPTTTSNTYSSAIQVTATETIKAIAVANGYIQSAVASATYTINYPQAAAPVFSVAAGTYTSVQSVAITDSTPNATIHYTTDGSTPTASSSVYSSAIQVTATETIQAIAVASGYTQSAVASATYTINYPQAATPVFSVAAGTYTSAQSVAITDSTPNATIHYTTDGSTPTASSSVYSSAIPVNATATIKAIAVASGYTQSAVASATYTIILPLPAPTITSLSPGYKSAGGTQFTLTVNGTGFVSSSVVYWGSTALTTQYVGATQLTATVPASSIASAGIYTISVVTPAPGGGTSNTMKFEVDTAGTTTAPTFTTATVTVTGGGTGTFPVTLPSTATSVSATCLNLPTGASCSYSASSGAVLITTSSSTPVGTYAITVVFTETLPGTAAGILLVPFLLTPLARKNRKGNRRGWLLPAAVVLMTLSVIAGCGGGGSTSTNTGGTTTPSTHQITSSGTVTLVVK